MIVQKYGGTSIGSAKMINRALDISQAQLHKSVLLVASAMGKTTDILLHMGTFAVSGKQQQSGDALLELKNAHYTALVDLLEVPLYKKGKDALDILFSELEELVRGLNLIREMSARSMDTLLSFGEYLSCTLIYYRALQRNTTAVLLDSRNFMKTIRENGRSIVNFDKTNTLLRKQVQGESNVLYIAQGFIASDNAGSATTLGRGGSDYSATIMGAALDAEEIQIWTDVDGIMTCDPRVIENAQTISELSYEEAAELSYFGARVIHPSAIQPAVEQHIPVRVMNSFNPKAPGSLIHVQGGKKGIQAIAGKGNITLVNVQSSRMLNAYGFLRKIFEVFETYHVPVDLIATSEVSVSLTIDDARVIDDVKKDLEAFSTVTVERDKAIISLVGKDLWKESRFTARVFNTLVDIPVRMISLGSSDINLSIVVPQNYLDDAIQSLHDALFEKHEQASGGEHSSGGEHGSGGEHSSGGEQASGGEHG